MRTLAQALPADAAQRIRNLSRRRRYHEKLDRPKVWPGDRLLLFWRSGNGIHTEAEHAKACADLNQISSTADYVSAWTRLNHLWEC